MVSISLMPPVDYCPSCEGRKADNNARQIARTREQQADPTAGAAGADATLAPGAPPPIAAEERISKPVASTTPSLLAPDLAVQASLAKTEATAPNTDNPAQRLQALQAYRSA